MLSTNHYDFLFFFAHIRNSDPVWSLLHTPQWQLFDAQRKLSTSWTNLGGLLEEFPWTREEHLMWCDGISRRKSKARSGCPGDIVWRHHKRVFALNWYWTRRIIKYRGKTSPWIFIIRLMRFFKFMGGLKRDSSLSPRRWFEMGRTILFSCEGFKVLSVCCLTVRNGNECNCWSFVGF